ncbi:hypothetical protein D3C81_1407200 [compost metagenome]
MIRVFMADHQLVEPAKAQAAQHRHHHLRARAGARGIARARVVQQRMRTRLHQHRGPLPHVEHHRTELAPRHGWAARQYERQHQQAAMQARRGTGGRRQQ